MLDVRVLQNARNRAPVRRNCVHSAGVAKKDRLAVGTPGRPPECPCEFHDPSRRASLYRNSDQVAPAADPATPPRRVADRLIVGGPEHLVNALGAADGKRLFLVQIPNPQLPARRRDVGDMLAIP